MDISLRLKTIASQIKQCDCVADIGTDHGYIPIYLLKSGQCKRVIASDINKGPVEKARLNAFVSGLEDSIECRLGGGLSVIQPGEADVILIAGMGGNLIRDILEEGIEVFKAADYAVLQPIQNPDILRKHIIEKGYTIIEEDLCVDDKKYYEIIKIKYENSPKKKASIYYEIGEKLITEKHPLVESYINFKIAKYKRINMAISDSTPVATKKKMENRSKIEQLEELLKCL